MDVKRASQIGHPFLFCWSCDVLLMGRRCVHRPHTHTISLIYSSLDVCYNFFYRTSKTVRLLANLMSILLSLLSRVSNCWCDTLWGLNLALPTFFSDISTGYLILSGSKKFLMVGIRQKLCFFSAGEMILSTLRSESCALLCFRCSKFISQRVKRYLTSHGVQENLLYDPNGRHGHALLKGRPGHTEILRWLRETQYKGPLLPWLWL